MRLILASTSPYRKQLLNRLMLPFEQHPPAFIEASPGSMPIEKLIKHNTLGKGESVLKNHPDAAVIASDQLAVCGDLVLGKPGTIQKARDQLSMLSGQTVTFQTGICLISQQTKQYACVPFRVHFRVLSKPEIYNYVEREKPLDCAGSFKSEGLGISLFNHMEGDDPTALIGLPLIRLSQWLNPLKR